MKLFGRVRNLVQFQLERFILRGALSRLMVIALTMGLIALGAGLLVYNAPTHASYEDTGSAIWWAFLRLTDSGYLGDDEGTLLRVVSTLLTVFGVVLFVGALIATMTQWLNNTIETLEAGYTPIAANNHVLILGWNNRTAAMVEDLVQAQDRVARFLSRHGGRRLHIVILAERVTPALAQEIRDRLGRGFDMRQVTLRSGTPLRLAHLKRVDYLHAAVILLPTREFDGDNEPDERTIKTLMSAAHAEDGIAVDTLPLVVAEIFDADRLTTARRAYPGAAEFIGTPLIISRLLAQNVRHPGLSWIYNELLGDGANEIFVRECPELAGRTLADVACLFERAVLIGVARDGFFLPLYADVEARLLVTDRLAFVARDFDDCRPRPGFEPDAEAPPWPGGRAAPRARQTRRERRLLVLGWNRKVASLLGEFDAYTREAVEIDVFSLLPIAQRETALRRRGVLLANARVRHIEGDLTSRYEMQQLEFERYDNVILLASDWLASPEAADARMLLGYLVLSQLLEQSAQPPPVVVETLSTDHAHLFDHANVERLVSPDLQASMLSRIALRRELHWVIDKLFGSGGADIIFRDVEALGWAGRSSPFAALARERAACGDVLLGVMKSIHAPAPRLLLNPEDRQAPITLAAGDRLVVMAMS